MYEPQGPHPREVYVRRRVAAAIVAVVAILAVVTALFLASRDDGTDTQDAATTGEAEQSDEAAATSSEETSASPTSETESDDDGGASRGRCADEDLRLQVWPSEPNVPEGESVRFFVHVVNTSDTTCSRDLAEAPLSFEVYRLDTNAKVWSSIDCTTPRGEDEAELRPNEPEPRQIDWTGRRSAEGGCGESDRTPAEVGAYQVYALVGNVFSPAATFNVVEAR